MNTPIEELRAKLENKRTELLNGIRCHSAHLTIVDEHELLDRMQVMYSRDQTVSLLETLTCTLGDVRAALRAINEGSYGVCMECGEDIAPRRLATIPWAAFCVTCQKALERRNEGRNFGSAWDDAA